MVCLCLGAFLRLYHADIMPRCYSEDSAADIFQLRKMVDLADYQGLFAIGPLSELPAWLVAGIGVHHFFPDLSALVLQRIINSLFDLGAVVVLYFAGKEAVGRRMGLFAAALGAVSKPLLTILVNGFSTSTFTFGMSLALWFTLRLMKRPGRVNFVCWGTSVAFLGYTYIYFPPFIPFFLFTTWTWFLARQWKQKGGRPGPLVWATFVVLLFYFLCNLNAFSADGWFLRMVVWGGVWLPCLVLGAVLVLAVLSVPKSFRKGSTWSWDRWLAGSWFAAVVTYPLFIDPALLRHLRFTPLLAPLVILGTGAWLFIQKARGKEGWPGPSIWVSLLVLTTFYLVRLGIFPENSWVLQVVQFGWGWVPCMALGAVMVCVILGLPKASPENPRSNWTGWVTGAWFSTLLSFPMVTNEEVLQRIKMQTLSGGNGFLSLPYLLAALHRAGNSFQKIFWGGNDRYDMSLPGTPFSVIRRSS